MQTNPSYAKTLNTLLQQQCNDDPVLKTYGVRYNNDLYLLASSSRFDNFYSEESIKRGVALQDAALAVIRYRLTGSHSDAKALRDLGELTDEEYDFLLVFFDNVHISQTSRKAADYIVLLHLRDDYYHAAIARAAEMLVNTGRGTYCYMTSNNHSLWCDGDDCVWL